MSQPEQMKKRTIVWQCTEYVIDEGGERGILWGTGMLNIFDSGCDGVHTNVIVLNCRRYVGGAISEKQEFLACSGPQCHHPPRVVMSLG